MIDGWDILCEIVLRWISMDLIDDKSTLLQVMAWCCQAASHYLSQCWPRSVLPYGVTRPQWVNLVKFDSDNGLEPVCCQIITWNKTGLLSIRLSGTKVNEFWIGILIFSLKKIPLKILSLKWGHFDQASICKIIIPPLQRSWKGGILVSPCPSVRLWTESCPLCIFNNTCRIHFIFAHLIKQLQKVCHV